MTSFDDFSMMFTRKQVNSKLFGPFFRAEAPPPNLSNLRQLTRHSFESITNTKSAKFAAEQEKMQPRGLGFRPV